MRMIGWQIIEASVADLETNENNPGGYDAINRYGDENLNPTLNQMIYGLDGEADTASIMAYPGLERWHRKGYWEKDLVDYDTENLKTSFGIYYLFDNSMHAFCYSSNFLLELLFIKETTDLVLKDILFFQNKIELKKTMISLLDYMLLTKMQVIAMMRF